MTTIHPTALTVDDQARPLAARSTPRFGWLLGSDWSDDQPGGATPGTGLRQSAYQLRVSDGAGGIVWDSGRIESSQQGHLGYAGPALEAGGAYAFTVRVWELGGDDPSDWAPPEPFECGLRDQDWEADWIRRPPGGSGPLADVDGAIVAAGGGATYLRTPPFEGATVEFDVRVQIRSAGWVLRGPDGSGYVWRLHTRQGLVVHTLLGDPPRADGLGPAEVVPFEVHRDRQHRVGVTVNGGLLATSVDGVVVDRRRVEGSAAGWQFGVYQATGEQAEFSGLRVHADGSDLVGKDGGAELDAWDNTTTSRQLDEWTLARREFDLRTSTVVRARAYLASHHHADLWINGTRVGGRGSFAYPGESYYQAVDVTDALVDTGRAAVAVLLHWYGNGQGRPAGEPGLLVRLVLHYADGSRQVVVSDSTWKVCEGPYLQAGYRNDEGDFVEHLDARRVPVGWDQPAYDDSAWLPATVVGRHPVAPFTTVLPQETRLAEIPVTATELLTAKDGTPVADFGQVVPGRPVVRFDAGAAGHVVRLRAGYTLTDDGRVATSTLLTQATDMSFPYTQVDGDQTYAAFIHLGFRYLELPDTGQVPDLRDVGAVVVHAAPPDRRPASFTSSDPLLDSVFDLMRRSALFGVQEQFVDTPTREKGQFLADAVNISFATMALFGERTSTRQAIREFVASARRYWQADDERGRYNAVYPNGDGKRDIPDFSLMMPEWVRRYHQESGDLDLVAEVYPALADTAGYVLRHVAADGPCAGLVTDLGGGGGAYLHGIVDWPAPGRFGYDMATRARTTVNAQAVGVLHDVAHLGHLLDRPDSEVSRFVEEAGRLRVAVNAALLGPDGRYVDGLLADGQRSAHAGQHATSFAVAFGIAPPEVGRQAGDHLAKLGMRQGPLTAHRLVQALAKLGRLDAVVRLFTNADDVGWARILAEGGTFTWEAWTLDEGSNHSQSHAWGAQAVVDILEHLLGLQVAAPGAANLDIRPPRCALTHASGTVPTERGDAAVSWHRTGEEFRVEVGIPVNVVATVHLPVPGGGHARFEVGSGRWAVSREGVRPAIPA